MENEKVQKQQLKKIINLYEGGKYRCHTYSDVSNIIIFRNHDANNEEYYIVEPNITEHKVFKLTNYKEATQNADIIVFLVAHNEFKNLETTSDKVVLDFCGVFN